MRFPRSVCARLRKHCRKQNANNRSGTSRASGRGRTLEPLLGTPSHPGQLGTAKHMGRRFEKGENGEAQLQRCRAARKRKVKNILKEPRGGHPSCALKVGQCSNKRSIQERTSTASAEL